MDAQRTKLISYHHPSSDPPFVLWLTGESRQLRIRHWEGLTITIFTSQELPQPVVDKELLTILDADNMQQDRNSE